MNPYYAGLNVGASQPTWTYDVFGNRTSQTWSGTGGFSVPGNEVVAYSTASNQATSYNGTNYQYDAAGNITGDTLNWYLYDAEGRVCAMQNSTGEITGYIYDASGIRVAKGQLTSFSCNFGSNGFSANTSWVLGPGGEQVTEYAVNAGTSTWQHTNVFANGQLLASYHDTDTYFALNDWLGTKRAEVNSTLTCANIYQSLPFGDGFNQGGSSPCPDATEHHFTGKERDAESGLDYFGARYYGSSMGRFMSPDPVIMSPARMANPQLWNAYSYVGNNPLIAVDPYGEELVRLGQHTDQEIKDRTKAINTQLKDKSLSADAKNALKAEKHTLGLEKEGNAAAGAYLKALDGVGQRNGLQLSDITLSTDVAHDFAGQGLSDAQQSRISDPNTQAFVLNKSGTMYLKSETYLFQNTFDATNGGWLQDFGGTVLRHEQVHTGGGGEFAAYSVQRQVWQYFKNNLSPETFKDVNDKLQKSIDSNRDH